MYTSRKVEHLSSVGESQLVWIIQPYANNGALFLSLSFHPLPHPTKPPSLNVTTTQSNTLNCFIVFSTHRCQPMTWSVRLVNAMFTIIEITGFFIRLKPFVTFFVVPCQNRYKEFMFMFIQIGRNFQIHTFCKGFYLSMS